jgi:alkanesulfonate monooxygenase SsuD/methylene tetrahydromethanopterin reductase-like flavin-dependent oxidoreductase (luciferase family)
VAKQATSVAVLTDNRLALGVGSSPWPEDYQFCGVPWEGRGRRMDEAIDIVQGLSAGGYFEYHGEAYDFPPLKITPTPTEPLPILVGGHATPALRRAARSDGWLHGGGDPADLPGLLDKLGKLRQEEGTADRPFEVHVISVEAFSVDGIHRLEEQGVTDVIVGFRWPYSPGPDTEPLQTKLDNLRRFADDVMAKVRS